MPAIYTNRPNKSSQFVLEIIGFNIESCLIAQAAGAHRIELCDNAGEGGTTPSYGFIKAARRALQIELYPIIRPRGGDFLYSEAEFDIMKADVLLCRQLGCNGVVLGILKEDGNVDSQRCSRLVQLAYPMEVTFHRAFDRTQDPLLALEAIIDIGCQIILTSGQQPQAANGTELIEQLIQAADDRIVIMPGSGVRSHNIGSIATQTNATNFHSSAIINANSKMTYQRPNMKEPGPYPLADTNEILLMIEQLEKAVR